MISSKKSKFTVLLGIIMCFIISCRQQQNIESYINTSELPELELNHQFTISDSEEILLQQVSGVKSDSEGRIFLTDQRALQIHVFDSLGSYITSIGREGSGPGEFQSLLKIYINENNQVIAFDIRQARNTIFAENNNVWEPVDMFLIEGHRYSIESADSLRNVILRESPPQTPQPGVYWYEHILSTGNLDSGLIEQNLYTFKERENLVLDNMAMQQLPFGRTTLIATDREGKIYLVWNDQFELAKYDAEFELIDSLSVPIPNQPVTNEERNEAIERLGDNFRSLGRKHIPETKPVVFDMLVSEDRSIWLQTFDSPEYLVLDSGGSPIRSFDLEDDLRLAHVDKKRLYALKLGENGYQVFVYNHQL